jgi:GR25 family glycosyltransferase involved in LPS biosynthesis
MKMKLWVRNAGFVILTIIVVAMIFTVKQVVFLEPMQNELQNVIMENSISIEKPSPMTTKISRNDYDCYLINLEKNEDRLVTFTTYYNNSDLKDIPFIKIKAIYGKDINYASFISPDAELNMTPGMVGCFLSHLEIYKKMANSDKNYALIFEDDARMIRNIQSSSIDIIPTIIPSDWDIVLLGYDISNPVHHKTIDFNNYKKMHGFFGTHAYLITKEGAAKFLKLVKKPFTNQIDYIMGDMCKNEVLNVYGLNSPVAWQQARFTDVQTMPES